MRISRRIVIATAATLPVAALIARAAMRPRSRRGPSVVEDEIAGERRVITSNGMPGHATGDFPNDHDPVPLRVQSLRFEMTTRPVVAERVTPLNFWWFGVAVNGVPFDPSGPFWNGDRDSGWEFEVLCPSNAVALGIDVNRAHTQGRGLYHYHGLPTALLWSERVARPGRPMQLLGHAADGFPIYGPDGPALEDDLGSPVRRLRPSYRPREGRRPGGPKGRYDGTFVEDFEFVPGLGDLDECNGRTGPTPEYPEGIYHYILTDEFPFIPRYFRGTADPSFRHGPPPGVSPPVPPELLEYRGVG